MPTSKKKNKVAEPKQENPPAESSQPEKKQLKPRKVEKKELQESVPPATSFVHRHSTPTLP
jgi:hypothetical protein